MQTQTFWSDMIQKIKSIVSIYIDKYDLAVKYLVWFD